ncbi:MAG: hypothetical protein AB7K09_05250 [Planctomycetota bacterium]
MAETRAHQQLKRLAAQFLLQLGAPAVALEAACPIATWRVDVAAWFDRPPDGLDRASAAAAAAPREWSRKQPPVDPRTVIVECKQSRADFLRDRRDQLALLSLRSALVDRRHWLEETHIKPREPHLRLAGRSLFPECEDWDFSGTTLRAWHHVADRLEQLERQLHGETKFSRLTRYALADRLFLLAPSGLLTRRDLPDGWGLLECPPRWLTASAEELQAEPASPLRVAIDAPPLPSSEHHRHRMLRNIAVAGTRNLAAGLRPKPTAE